MNNQNHDIVNDDNSLTEVINFLKSLGAADTSILVEESKLGYSQHKGKLWFAANDLLFHPGFKAEDFGYDDFKKFGDYIVLYKK